MTQRKKLHLITASEWAAIKKQRETTEALQWWSDVSRKAEEKRKALIASPPPAGYTYRCTECGHGTNAADRKCTCVLL